MYFSASTVTATLSILAGLTPQVNAHCRFMGASGDADRGALKTSCLGYDPSVPRGRAAQTPYQIDTVVFSDPIVPATKWSKYWKKPRNWWSAGCGATIQTLNAVYEVNDPFNFAKYKPAKKNYVYYQTLTPTDAMIQTVNMTQNIIDSGHLPKCTANGWLKLLVYQINDDGAGPFRCRIDPFGNGDLFGDWINIPAGGQVPGCRPCHSVRKAGSYHSFTLTVPIPAGTICNAKYGSTSNVCIMRCENFAINGPFGACIPFQLQGAEATTTVTVDVTQATPAPAPSYGNPGYNVNSGGTDESGENYNN
ncbi:hypothetical protein TWF694_010917 [Orbilia ellipsospora]|uniref:Uncharacterized protein n=1 Tax=Orbilia ellipsospora TaxID=2528407 RepID=A0AAV9X8E7_9PEZI